MPKISIRVVCVNGKHPRSQFLMLPETDFFQIRFQSLSIFGVSSIIITMKSFKIYEFLLTTSVCTLNNFLSRLVFANFDKCTSVHNYSATVDGDLNRNLLMVMANGFTFNFAGYLSGEWKLVKSGGFIYRLKLIFEVRPFPFRH